MLPGGITPVTHLIAMIRTSSPRSAAGLLMTLPAERLSLVTAAMSSADVVRLVPALKPEGRRSLVRALDSDQLFEVIRTAPLDQATVLVETVPTDRLGPVVAGLSDAALAALLGSLPPEQRQRVEDVTEPRRERAVLALDYRHSVTRAFTRGNVEVRTPPEAPEAIILVAGLRWRIAVAARHGDDGRIAVRDAEDGAYKLRATGALAVTDVPAAGDVLRYCREARAAGRPLETVTWVDARHDGDLMRTLVSLFK